MMDVQLSLQKKIIRLGSKTYIKGRISSKKLINSLTVPVNNRTTIKGEFHQKLQENGPIRCGFTGDTNDPTETRI